MICSVQKEFDSGALRVHPIQRKKEMSAIACGNVAPSVGNTESNHGLVLGSKKKKITTDCKMKIINQY